MDFIYIMNGAEKAPTSGGDTRSWFLFYKWAEDVGRTWVPMPEGIAPGDRLWFSLDRELMGRVTITRVESLSPAPDGAPPSPYAVEAWYDIDEAVRAPADLSFNMKEAFSSDVLRLSTGPIPDRMRASWSVIVEKG